MLSAAATLVLPLVWAATPVETEYEATRHIVTQFQTAGRTPPAGDPILTRVARRLSDEALKGTSSRAADLLSIAHAMSEEGGWDPPPRALVVQGSGTSLTLQSVLGRGGFADQPASHLGVGAAQQGERSAVTLLMVERRAVLQPFLRHFPSAGAKSQLCGELLQPYEQPRIYVTQPQGDVVEARLAKEDGVAFCADLSFPAAGEYAVEVVAEGPRGPDVTALFFVTVGPQGQRAQSSWFQEPATPEAARRALLERINKLRDVHGLVDMGLDDTLCRIAQAYAEQIAKEGALVHQTEHGHNVVQRLRAAWYPFEGVAENLATASGPLAAHFALEQSPGHRQNLLDPRFDHLGVGIATQKSAEGNRVIIVEILVAPVRNVQVNINNSNMPGPTQMAFMVPDARPDEDPVAALYKAYAQKRAKLALGAAKRSEVLETIARAHVEQARTGSATLSTHDHVFAAETGEGPLSLYVVGRDDAEKLAVATDPDALGFGIAPVPGPRRGVVERFVVVVSRAR